jgi:hypothetical protein
VRAPKQSYPEFPHPGDAFLTPAEWLTRIAEYELAFKAAFPDYPPGDFRGRLQKDPHEAWMAAMFGFCYACAHRKRKFSIRHINEEENTEVDAIFRWREGRSTIEAPVQVKELPPLDIASKETVESLVAKVAAKYPTSPDLIVAIHGNRSHPDGWTGTLQETAAQLWYWAAADPMGRRLFITRWTPAGQKTYFVPFKIYTNPRFAKVRAQ